MEVDLLALVSGADYETQIAPLLDRLSTREADVVRLSCVQHMKAPEIATALDTYEAAIAYRLERGTKRLGFWLAFSEITEEQMRADLGPLFEPVDLEILVGMWWTTSGAAVAEKLTLPQGRVRHRFFKAVAKLKADAANDARYEMAFSYLVSPNFLRSA